MAFLSYMDIVAISHVNRSKRHTVVVAVVLFLRVNLSSLAGGACTVRMHSAIAIAVFPAVVGLASCCIDLMADQRQWSITLRCFSLSLPRRGTCRWVVGVVM